MSTSVIILAAGASRRMEQPKALLRFNGESCLSLVLNACLASRAGQTILVLGADAERVRAEAEARAKGRIPGSILPVVNADYERGQTSTVKTGLETASPHSDAYVLFPVDHPLVTGAEIDALIARFEARPRGRTIFVAAHENRRGHPVLFSASHRSAILELEDSEPLNEYVRRHEGETEQVPTDNPGVVAGMNTAEEFEHLLGLYRAAAGRGGGRAG